MARDLAWRLEGADGFGVYRSSCCFTSRHGAAFNRWVERYSASDERPDPARDGIPHVPWGMYREGEIKFAFPNVETARAWFNHPEDLEAWTAEGLRLRAYDVTGEQAAHGKRQLVFRGGKRVLDLPATALWDADPASLETQALEG